MGLATCTPPCLAPYTLLYRLLLHSKLVIMQRTNKSCVAYHQKSYTSEAGNASAARVTIVMLSCTAEAPASNKGGGFSTQQRERGSQAGHGVACPGLVHLRLGAPLRLRLHHDIQHVLHTLRRQQPNTSQQEASQITKRQISSSHKTDVHAPSNAHVCGV
jgi:hypothetical protein